jgi:hypothetical protein
VADVKIAYSRHAKRRMRLYGIAEEDIEQVVAKPDKEPELEGNRYVVCRSSAKFRGLPLKVIYVFEGECMVILSAYPLKKAYRRRSR